MMKSLVIILILLAFPKVMVAQDTIYMRNTKKVIAKVIQTRPKGVSFHKINEPQTEIYTVDLEYIDSIFYENGSVDRFTWRKKRLPPGANHRMNQMLRNRQTFHSGSNSTSSGAFVLDNTDRADGRADDINDKAIIAVYTSYERMIANHKIGLSVMPFIGMNRKAFGSGFGVTLYPKPYYKAIFHMGPQLLLYRSQIYRAQFNEKDGYSTGNIYPTTILSFTYNLGLNIHIDKNWMVASDFGIGHGLLNTKRKELDKLRGYGDRHGYIFNDIMVNAKLGVAYRF